MSAARFRRAAFRCVSVVTALAAVLLGIAAPASASGPLPYMTVSITTNIWAHYVCIDGNAEGLLVEWQATISGSRSDGGLIAPVFLPASGSVFHLCYTVAKFGQPSGAYAVTFTGVPIGTSQAPWVTLGGGLWDSSGDYPISSG